jgi:two-component system nitrogen regulation response regulator NtrX
MPHADGIAVLAASKQADPDRPVVLVTAHGTMHTAVQAMRQGADDILEKPVVLDELEVLLARVREKRRLLRENTFLRAETVGGELVVASPAMQAIVELVQRVAKSRATVLVRGESGTGKERIAALLHKHSDRAQRPFVKLNCAAIPEPCSRASCSATRRARSPGRNASAARAASSSPTAARCSSTRSARCRRRCRRSCCACCRKASSSASAATARCASTCASSPRPTATSTPRWPPAASAPTCSGGSASCRWCCRRCANAPRRSCRWRSTSCAPGPRSTPRPKQALRAWHWPGNVRELQNVVQRVGILCDGDVVTGEVVRRWLQPTAPVPPPASEPRTDLRAAERRSVAGAGRSFAGLRRARAGAAHAAHNGGNRTRTAEMLGIGVRTLFNKLQDAAALRTAGG